MNDHADILVVFPPWLDVLRAAGYRLDRVAGDYLRHVIRSQAERRGVQLWSGSAKFEIRS